MRTPADSTADQGIERIGEWAVSIHRVETRCIASLLRVSAIPSKHPTIHPFNPLIRCTDTNN
ncbi:MAG: hypothetical protein VSS75_012160 [Candidatus Parabeggiatoa sp.]|nr:hypothetical protein [Candidatus Parabeggiatoa sp.]